MSDEIVKADFDACDALLRQGKGRGDYISANIDHIDSWKEAAESGNAAGQLLYGLCFFYGHGEQEDEETAIQWFLKSSKQGNAQSQCTLGMCYFNGWGVKKDVSEAFDWFRMAAAANHIRGLLLLGFCYSSGDGVAIDNLSAFDAWRLAAEQKNAEAERLVGIAYLEGLGIEADEDRAREWLLDAAEKDDEEALIHLRELDSYCENQAVDVITHQQAVSNQLVLTREIAAKVLNANQSVNLREFTAIEDEAADLIRQYQDTLPLEGLAHLSDVAALHLSKSQSHWLLLNGLTELSDRAAKALSGHQGTLSLEGLVSISDVAAEELSRHSGLMRNGCENERRLELTGRVEVQVWRFRKKQQINRIAFDQRNVLMRDEALKFVADPPSVDLSKYTHITLGAAIALGGDEEGDGCEIELDLSGLVELDPDIAERIANNCSDLLDLSGLTTVSGDLVAALERFSGCIRFNGLKEINEIAASETYCLFGDLELNGLETLTVGLAEALAVHSSDGNNPLSLDGVRKLTPECAEELAQHVGWLNLNGLEGMSGKVASALAEHCGGLSLNGLKRISDTAAKVLSNYDGELNIKLENLPESAAAILRKHPSFSDED